MPVFDPRETILNLDHGATLPQAFSTIRSDVLHRRLPKIYFAEA